MEIKIEVYSDEFREKIEEELRTTFDAVSQIYPDIPLWKIIVTNEFDKVVNKHQSTTTYQSVREINNNVVTAEAKVINTLDGNCIIFSHNIYQSKYDNQVRTFLYIHEIMHLITQPKFVMWTEDSNLDSILKHNLKIFIDEYFADRNAYQIIDQIFPKKSDLWKIYIQKEIENNLTFLTDLNHDKSINSAKRKFSNNKDIILFINTAMPTMNTIGIVISHTFSLLDAYSIDLEKRINFPYINEHTMSLVDYAREKYSNGNYCLSDGKSKIKHFYNTFKIDLYNTQDSWGIRIIDAFGK